MQRVNLLTARSSVENKKESSFHLDQKKTSRLIQNTLFTSQRVQISSS